MIITPDLSGPKPDDGTETVIYLEQLNDGLAMEYWSFLRADVYAILIGPRPPSHFSFAAMVDEVHRLHQQTADLPIIVRVTLATNQDDRIVSFLHDRPGVVSCRGRWGRVFGTNTLYSVELSVQRS